MDVRQPAPTSKKGFSITRFFRLLNAPPHIVSHGRIHGKVILDKPLRLAHRHTELLREAKGRNAINHTKVRPLGVIALQRGDTLHVHLKDARGGSRMDVMPKLKIVHHIRITAQVGHDAQLDLRIVGRDERPIREAGDKRVTYTFPLRGAHRDILNVWIARGEPPGRGYRLIVVRMDAPRNAIHKCRKGIHVGRYQLFFLTIGQYCLNGRVAVRVFTELHLTRIVLPGLGSLRLFSHLKAIE